MEGRGWREENENRFNAKAQRREDAKYGERKRSN
jgi:hypothetical protein